MSRTTLLLLGVTCVAGACGGDRFEAIATGGTAGSAAGSSGGASVGGAGPAGSASGGAAGAPAGGSGASPNGGAGGTPSGGSGGTQSGGAGGSGATGGSGGGPSGGSGGIDPCNGTCGAAAECLGGGVCQLASKQAVAEWLSVNSKYVFWTTSGGMARMDKAGKSPIVQLSAPADNEGTVATEVEVYWAALDKNEIRVAPVALNSSTVFAAGLSAPRTLALDGGFVYWTSASSVQRKAISGGVVETLAQNLSAPWDIAVDGSGVYFSTQTGIYRCIKQVACSPTLLVAAGSVTGWDATAQIALGGARVYWTLSDAIGSVPKSGGAVTSFVAGGSAEGVDLWSGFLFTGIETANGGILRAPAEPTPGPFTAIVAGGQVGIDDLLIDGASKAVFWISTEPADDNVRFVRKAPIP